MIHRYFIYSLALTLLIFQSSMAQLRAAQTIKTNEGREARQELEQKALALLEEVVAEARRLRRPENRIRVQAIAANLFWTRDENRARALFKEAMQGLGEVLSSIDSTDPQYYSLVQAPAQLRQETLQMIAPHDPQLALEFLRATHQPPPPQTDPRYKPQDYDLQMELSLASQIADSDPRLALQIAEESLAKGASSALPDIINQLRSKDRAGASKLTNALIKKLRAENLFMDQDAANAAVSLLRVLNYPDASDSSQESNNPKDATPAVDSQSYQELLDLVLTTALNASLDEKRHGNERNVVQIFLVALEPMLPQVERLAPTRVTALRRKLEDYKKSLDPQTRFWTDYQDLINSGSVEALLEAARRAPIEVRNQLYQQAASKALDAGDNNRARQIIEDNISNPYERKQWLENLDQQMFWRTANDGKIDEARQLLSRLRSNEERVGMLVQLATTASGKGDNRSALQLLEEARALVSNRAENYAQFQAQLQVAQAYASLEPAQSFDILEAQVSQLNELIAAAEVLNGFDQQYFKDGEFMPQSGTLGNIVTQYVNNLSPLARMDFDRCKSVAGRFQRPETRVMAGLSIAQGILSDNLEAVHMRGNRLRIISIVNRGNKRVPVVRF